MVAAAELSIDTSASALAMAQAIFGSDVNVVGASYSGDSDSSGLFSGGDTISPGVTPSDTGVILSTGDAVDFTNSTGDSNHNTNTSTNTSGVNGDSDFDALAGSFTRDAAFIEVDFIPTTSMLSLQFVFSSEEYPEYVNSIYNDLVGIWINGAPIDIAVGAQDTSVSGISTESDAGLFVDNSDDQFNSEMDGFTVTLTVKMPVVPGQVNSIKIGVADVGDSSYDSSLLIAAGSAQGQLVAYDDTISVHPDGSTTFDVVANDVGPGNSTLAVTHINGIEVSAGDTIVLTTGQEVTLNADGTLTLTGDGDIEDVNFSYTVATGGGNSNLTDTAFVTVNSVPCFVAGTMIATPGGEMPVECLEPGMMVLTHDNGPQPLRWIGRRTVPALANFAPIHIDANAFGNHGKLVVSPQHRILIRDIQAELWFGETEVLVSAKDLVNGDTVRQVEGDQVEYVHILFDEHQVVYSEGLATESYMLGPQITDSFDAAATEELLGLFPEIDVDSATGYPSAVRRILKAHEARVLMTPEQAA